MADAVRPSYRTTLEDLGDAWSRCQACELGVSRVQVGGSFVFGEGASGGIMFVGEGPGKDEEAQGRPFIGKSGRFFRRLLEDLQFNKYYITNTVCCRSWDFSYDTQGTRIIIENRRTKQKEYKIDDVAPKPSQRIACKPRLIQQIYSVDPVLIVALGGAAAETLLGRSVKIQAEAALWAKNGIMDHIRLPGAGFIPQLTAKGAWVRRTGPKGNRQLIAPYIQNLVIYPIVPLLHPAFAAANHRDQRQDSPMHIFTTGLQLVRNVYAAYMGEVYGDQHVTYEISDKGINEALEDDYVGSDYD